MKTAPEIPEKEAEGAAYHQWFFAGAEFDERSLELRANGQLVALERKSLEVLRQLLYRAGEIATKDELLEAVWPGRILSETILAKCISRVRQVLGDEEQLIVKTVHGYGYRLMAPVTVKLSSATLPPAKLGLAAGDHPPMRPEWVLVRRLGAGGQGEVWLCRHEKLGSHRVLKFALDESGLAAIKREITLHRLLLDSLGVREDLSTVIDWNLRETPCFIEFEYAESGNLESWAQAQGGLGTIPLSQRLDLVVRIADILAAAHSVGVLHKDLKPTNVLIGADSSGKPVPKLADFGSGGLLDPLRLDAIGITRMGFSRAAFGEDTPATALYRAPELMVGQLATVQADIYSLGVMLYQVVIGDFQQPLAPGWERNIGDPLLSEDIGLAVAGDRSRRLADAAALAERLRTLEARRAQKLREQDERARLALDRTAAEARARQAELTVTRLRARRNWMLTALSVLIVGMALSLGLFLEARRARDEAKAAAASSQAVADFLSRDMFSVVSSRPLRELSVRELLESAASNVETQTEFKSGAAAQIHAALGHALLTVEAYSEAERQLDRALARYEEIGKATSEAAVTSAAELASVKGVLSRPPEAFAPLQAMVEPAGRELGSLHPSVLRLRQSLAYQRLKSGAFSPAIDDFRVLLAGAQAGAADAASVGGAHKALGYALLVGGNFVDAVSEFSKALVNLESIPTLPPASLVEARFLRAQAETELEDFKDATADLDLARRRIHDWVIDDKTALTLAIDFVAAQLSLRAGDVSDSIKILESVIGSFSSERWRGQPDPTPEPRRWLALAYLEAGRLDDAEKSARAAQTGAAKVFGMTTPWYQMATLAMADVARVQGDIPRARRILSSVDRGVFERLDSDHPFTAELLRVEGLVSLAEGKVGPAQASLKKSAEMFERRYGPHHRFAHRAAIELARAAKE